MEKIWTWWCTLMTITSAGQPRLSLLCTGIVSGSSLSAGWQTMTAHFKMFKKIECNSLGNPGDRQGGMRISDYSRRSVRLTKRYQDSSAVCWRHNSFPLELIHKLPAHMHSFKLHWQLQPPIQFAYDIHVYDTQIYGICTVTFLIYTCSHSKHVQLPLTQQLYINGFLAQLLQMRWKHTIDFPIYTRLSCLLLCTWNQSSDLYQLLRAGSVQKMLLGGVWWADLASPLTAISITPLQQRPAYTGEFWVFTTGRYQYLVKRRVDPPIKTEVYPSFTESLFYIVLKISNDKTNQGLWSGQTQE